MKAAALLGAAGLLAALLLAPAAALGGWRAAFLAAGAVPVGATVLLLVARLTGADWTAALAPLARGVPLLLPALVPVVVQQALIVPPPHLAGWMAWPAFAARGLAAIGLWWWLSRRVVRSDLSELGAGLGLVGHGIAVTIVGTDWILGTAPAQPQSAIGMVLAAMQILAAGAAACVLGLGADRVRRDLSFLLIAAALALFYLLFMDYLIVWYGNLPPRVGWYLAREALPWRLLPPLAPTLALAVPIGMAAFARSDRGRRIAGGTALAGLAVVAAWQVAPPQGWPALAAALAATALLLAPLARVRR